MSGFDTNQLLRQAVASIPALKPFQGVLDAISNAQNAFLQAIIGFFKQQGMDVEAPLAALTGQPITAPSDPEAARTAASGVPNPGVQGGEPADRSENPSASSSQNLLAFLGFSRS